MSTHVEAFRAAMRATGLEPPENIVPGRIHRFPGIGKSPGNNGGRCKLFDDGLGGWYMDYASGLYETWHAERGRKFTPAEMEEFRQRRELAEGERLAAELLTHHATAKEAAAILSAASGDPASHPYAVAKGVPLGPRVKRGAWPQRGWTDALLIPVYGADGNVWTLEAINTDGKKDYLKGGRKRGGFHPLGTIRGASRVLIGEGLATVAAVHAVDGSPAVAAMDAGNLLPAALSVRELAPDALLVFLADNDAKPDGSNPGLMAATEAARAVGGVVAVPELDGKKCDFWDVWHEKGPEAVRSQLERTGNVEKTAEKLHPLSIEVPHARQLHYPKFILPGFIAAGVVAIAGAHGAGKTTALVPLALTAAGIHRQGDLLAPQHWRHVVYITEDVSQVHRIIAGLVDHAEIGTWDHVTERVHLVEAVRLNPSYAVQVGEEYRQKWARMVECKSGQIELPPLVVFDTSAASFSMENENDNSAVSAVIAALKQAFSGLPVWVIGHVAKASLSRDDAKTMSFRGASAWEADAHQTLFLAKESAGEGAEEMRYLVRGKSRFESPITELPILSDSAEITVQDEYGEDRVMVLRWAICDAAGPSRAEVKNGEVVARETRMRGDILDAVSIAWDSGLPLSRNTCRKLIIGKSSSIVSCIEELLQERWLIEIDFPASLRTNNRQRYALARLSPKEREELVDSGAFPPRLDGAL